MHLLDSELQEALTSSGIISDAEFEKARKEAARSGLDMLEELVGTGTITEEYARDYIAAYLEVPTVNLEKVDIEQKALELVPESFAKSRQLVLFAYDEKKRVVKAGMLDPRDLATIEFLRAKLDAWIDVFMVTPKSFRYGLNQYNRRIGEDFNKTIQDNIQKTLGEAGAVDAIHLAE